MSINHPYKKYEALKAWKILSRGLADLEANGDIEQKTQSVYIIGYLSKLLDEANLLERNQSRPPSKVKASYKGFGLEPVEGVVRKVVPKKTVRKPPTKKTTSEKS